MAEVTGDLGGQPIQLNNAATEATLKEILAAVLRSGITGRGGKAQKELEKKLAELAKATEQLTDEQKEALKKAKELKKKKDEELKQAKELGEALEGLLASAKSVITGMTNLMSSLSRLDNSMTSAAQSMSAIPLVGGTLATVFGAVAGAAERTYKAFQQAASVGANFGGSITTMVNSATSAGLTFDQFSGIISRTGESLAYLGGSTEQGAKRLAQLGKEIKDSPISKDLARMGYTTEQINESMAKYSGVLAKTGALQGMNNTQLVEQTGRYLQNLDAVSKLTGQTKKELEDQRAERLKDAQFRYITNKMDAKSQEELNKFLDTLPPELRKGAKEVIATGTSTTQAGDAFMTYMSGSANKMQGVHQQILSSGKFTADNARDLSASVQSEAQSVAKGDLAGNLLKFGKEYDATFAVQIDDLSKRNANLKKVEDDRAAAAAAAAANQKKGQEGLDPDKLKKFQEQIAQVSNQFTMVLANSGLLEKFIPVFTTMINFVSNFIVPGFQFLANNAGLVALVLTPLVALVGAVNLAYAALELQLKFQIIKAGIASGALGRLAASAFAPLLPLIGLAKAAFAATLPFLKFVAPILLLIYGFKKLYEAGFTVGDVFEAVGDFMQNLMYTLADGFLWLLDKVTFGDANKKIKDAQKKLDLEKEELKEKEKARDERRRQKREERGIKEEENKVTQQGIDLQKQENAQRQEANQASAGGATQGLDLSTPQKMFESAMRRQQGAAAQPGAAAASAAAMPGLGGMAARFESGSAGSSAVGWDSTGGTSYGKYQIATKTGTMNRFMEHLKATNPEAYQRLSAAGPADSGKEGAFAQEWKKLAGEGKLAQSEHDFIKKTHYDVGMGNVKNKGLQDMIGKSKALQEVMWSTSVQHGGGGAGSIFNKVFKEGMSEQDLIKAIYAERGTKFGSSTAAVQQSVMNRFAQEQQLALGLVGQPGAATPTATAAQTAVAQAPTTPGPKPATTMTASAQAPAQTQENPATLLASLNSKMDTLIALERRANDTRDRQLSAARATAGEVTPYAAA